MKKSTQLQKALFILCFLFSVLGSAFAQDVYEIRFTAGYTQHRAALLLYSDGSGTMRVRYYSNGRTQMVEQYIAFEKTTAGYRLTGYNPVYPGTSVRYPGYIADNFFISQDENGRPSCINIDDDGDSYVCSIRLVTGYYAKNEFLSDFSWKIN